MAGRQGREELIKQGLLEMMEQGKRVPGRVAALSAVPRALRALSGVPGDSGLWVPWTGAHGDCGMRPLVEPVKFDGSQTQEIH